MTGKQSHPGGAGILVHKQANQLELIVLRQKLSQVKCLHGLNPLNSGVNRDCYYPHFLRHREVK